MVHRCRDSAPVSQFPPLNGPAFVQMDIPPGPALGDTNGCRIPGWTCTGLPGVWSYVIL